MRLLGWTRRLSRLKVENRLTDALSSAVPPLPAGKSHAGQHLRASLRLDIYWINQIAKQLMW